MKKTVILAALVFSFALHANQLRVAVASNFEHTLGQLAQVYKELTGIEIIVISGSTGQLYAQIMHGAPFDVFMAADINRPKMLIDDRIASEYFVYAQGILVLIANQSDCDAVFNHDDLEYFAIADPALAPYGLAAKQFLLSINQWDELQAKLVIGTNATQALHMVVSGNARAGLVAQSQLLNAQFREPSCQKEIPAYAIEPIKQAMVLLNSSSNKKQLLAFKQFIQSERAQNLIKNNGYLIEAQQ